ncbi:MAG: hypothetical protein M1831_002037 [Alyxoria varia]|nr:MAG: hypothetical protein M1831_002037 [Alyxoria varia]
MDHEYNDILASSRKPRRTVASFRESRRRRRAKDLKEQQEDFGMALNPRHANIRTYPRLSDRPIVPMKPISPSKAVASHSGGSLPRSPTILEEDESDDD